MYDCSDIFLLLVLTGSSYSPSKCSLFSKMPVCMEFSSTFLKLSQSSQTELQSSSSLCPDFPPGKNSWTTAAELKAGTCFCLSDTPPWDGAWKGWQLLILLAFPSWDRKNIWRNNVESYKFTDARNSMNPKHDKLKNNYA